MAQSMSGSGGSTRRRPLRQPPVVDDDDVGCSCPTQRLLRSLLSSLVSRARGALGSRAVSRPKSAPSSSSSSSASTTTTTAAFTSTSGASATTVDSSVEVESWGPVTYAATSTLHEDEDGDEARRQSRRRRQQRIRKGKRRRRRVARAEEEEEGASAVAVEVESAAPYEDFRESMVAMVVEKEMYAWEELNALLHQFLILNSPRHHALILHAFADLWAPRSALFCPPSPCLAL